MIELNICEFTHVFPRFPTDTEAAFMIGLCEQLAAQGNQVFVLTAYDTKFNWKGCNKNFSIRAYKYIFPNRFHVLGYSRTLRGDIEFIKSTYLLAPFMFFFGFLNLLRLVKEKKIDVIHAHWILPNGFIAALVSKITKVPVVISLPGSDVFIAEKHPFLRPLARFAFNTAKSITTNSPHLADSLVKLGADPKKFQVIIYGVEPDKLRPTDEHIQELRSKFNIGRDELVVLAVARLVYKKGLGHLIRAIPEVLKKRKDVKFIIVGDGEQRQELEGLRDELQVADNLIFAGRIERDHILHYYNLADIFVMPSIRDQAGNLDDQSVSLVEAMACGKPVIATNFAGYQIVVKDGENGFLVNEKDNAQIAEAIIKLADSDEMRHSLGKKSRELVESRFCWREIAKTYIECFNEARG